MQNRNGIGCATVVLLLVFGVVLYFDYHAYRLRFPDAPAWTYLFK